MEFIIENWVAISLTLIAFIFTWFVASYYGKRQWNVAHLTLAVDADIPLIHSTAKLIPELKFIYKNSPVSPKLCALNMCLVNTGKRDIRIEANDGPLCLKLPKGYKWKSCETFKRKNTDKALTKKIDDRTMALDWQLLKVGEAILIFALVDKIKVNGNDDNTNFQNDASNIAKRIHVDHRILDTSAEVRLVNSVLLDSELHKWFIGGFVGVFTALCVGFIMTFVQIQEATDRYSTFISDNQTQDILLHLNDSSIVLSRESFDNLILEPLSGQIEEKTRELYLIFAVFMLLLSLSLVLLMKIRKEIRLEHLIDSA